MNNKKKEVKVCRNGLVALADRKFEIDSANKEDFLNTLNPSTAKTLKGVLLKVDKFEKLIGKSVYNFNLAEVNELIENEFSYKSVATVRTGISYIKKYINYCIEHNLTTLNPFEIITDYSRYVNKNAMENKYLTYQEVREIEEKLVNFNDRCMLELLFNGLKPDELINLKEMDIDFEEKGIVATDKKGNVRKIFGCSERCFELLKLTISQQAYYLNNGTAQSRKDPNKILTNGLGVRTLRFPESVYVFKTAGGKKIDVPMEQKGLQARVRVIREWVGNPYITVTNLYHSGILHEAYSMMKEKGIKELDRYEVAQIAGKFNYCEPYVPTGNDGHLVVNARVGSLQELIKVGVESIYLN
jgi:integrase